MNTVEKVQALMVGEEHVRHDESKQWCVKYRTALMELAVELDAMNAKIFSLEHANPQRWETAAILKAPYGTSVEKTKLSKSEATSKRMKAWWAAKKAKEHKKP